jgi:hypothetical protein
MTAGLRGFAGLFLLDRMKSWYQLVYNCGVLG